MAAIEDEPRLPGGCGTRELPAGSDYSRGYLRLAGARDLDRAESEDSSKRPSADGMSPSVPFGSFLREEALAEGSGLAPRDMPSDLSASKEGDPSPRETSVLAGGPPADWAPIAHGLLAGLLRNEGDAWGAFVAERRGFVRHACRIVRTRGRLLRGDALDEAEAAVWRRLWMNKPRLERYAARPAYLVNRLAEHVARHLLSRRRKVVPLDGEPADRRLPADPPRACLLEDELERFARAIRKALGVLSERYCRILGARFASGMPLQAIAQAEGCSKPRVCAILDRASTQFLAALWSKAPHILPTEDAEGRRTRMRASFAILSRVDDRALAELDGRALIGAGDSARGGRVNF